MFAWAVVEALFGKSSGGGGGGTVVPQTTTPAETPTATPPQASLAPTVSPLAQQASIQPGTPTPGTTSADPSLPPFPSGWEPDDPVPPEVVARANALLSSLWSQGNGSTTREMTGGRWITYKATDMGNGVKGVTAWRVKGSNKGLTSSSPSVVPISTPGLLTSTKVSPLNQPSATVGLGHMPAPPQLRHAMPQQRRAVQSALSRLTAARAAAHRQAPQAPSPGEGDGQGQHDGDAPPTTSPDAAADMAPAPAPSDVDDSSMTDYEDETEGELQ